MKPSFPIARAIPQEAHLISPLHFRVAFEACSFCLRVPFPTWAQRLIPPSDQGTPGEWLPATLLDRLYVELVQTSGKADLGVLMVSTPAMTSFGLLPALVMNSPDLRTAVMAIERYSELVQEKHEVQLETGSTCARLKIQPMCTSPAGLRCRTDMTLLGLTLLLKMVGLGESGITRTCFPYPRPSKLEASFGLFDGELAFGAQEGMLTFSAGLLDRPVPNADPIVFNSLRMRADLATAELRNKRGLLRQLMQVLEDTLHERPYMASVAAQLGMHERSLRRSLSGLGITFNGLLEQAQIERAKALIARGDLPMQQVAAQAGYQNVTSFHRAFVRVVGVTPGTWRKQ